MAPTALASRQRAPAARFFLFAAVGKKSPPIARAKKEIKKSQK